MKLWLEACRATLAAAVAAVQAESPDAPHLVSVAKSYVTERSVQIIQDCVQLHGGLGVTTEHNLHIYLRRAMLDRQLYGSPREHRELVAQYIGL
jgi:alkylation response protein AidB-like acyl-CoA dehydrogenase